MVTKIFDLIIIGAGPAGITCAVYAARKGMSFLVVSGDIGGQTAWSGDIENYLGYQFITGTELTAKFEEHMEKYGVQVHQSEIIQKIEKTDSIFKIISEKNEYLAHAVIIATGKKSKELNVPGETEFRGKGVAYCATCDAPLFKSKDVAVIGGGNSALEAVIQLAGIASKVYVVNNEKGLGGDKILREKISSFHNVSILNSSQVKEIKGEKFVNEIIIQNSEGSDTALKVQGVFIEIGLIPNSNIECDVEKNDKFEIKVNNKNETSIPGIFSAGDVTDVPEKQIIISAGEGAKAALGAYRYLMMKEEK